MNTMPLVQGEITFEETPHIAGATLYARLEKVTAADASSELVAEYVKRDVDVEPITKTILSFAIAGNTPDPEASYIVRVHIDVDQDGEVSQGDFISMQSYPVITFGYPRHVSILVRKVS